MARNRILVVEDDESISKVIQKNLTVAGYAVVDSFLTVNAIDGSLINRDVGY